MPFTQRLSSSHAGVSPSPLNNASPHKPPCRIRTGPRPNIRCLHGPKPSKTCTCQLCDELSRMSSRQRVLRLTERRQPASNLVSRPRRRRRESRAADSRAECERCRVASSESGAFRKALHSDRQTLAGKRLDGSSHSHLARAVATQHLLSTPACRSAVLPFCRSARASRHDCSGAVDQRPLLSPPICGGFAPAICRCWVRG
jgi:hypothetical protein